MQTQKQKIGEIGENIAVKHLKKLGFKILDRNYRKKWGEIDIVAEKKKSNSFLKNVFAGEKNKTLHFIEVKSISYNPSRGYAPEANIRLWKKKRLSRAIRTYLAEKKIPYDKEFEVNIMAIFVDLGAGKAKIRMTENVILDV